MVTFFDLIQDDEFRNFVSNRIEYSMQKLYSFPTRFPLLYRYRTLSTYAIDDIVNGIISLSSIGEFNDVFDGAFHQYGTLDEIEKVAEKKWNEIETLRIAANIPGDLIERNDIVDSYRNYLKTESRLKFRELEFLGTYVCSFSQENSSTLMWAHYADSNKGLCMEYDFNGLPVIDGNILRKSIFPIAYTSKPIDVSDLLVDDGNQVCQYPLDAAILCTALNKDSVWQYEKEWRIVFVLAYLNHECKRIQINSLIKPSKICFGYHFLKPFFYYDHSDRSEYDKCAKLIRKFFELIEFIHNNNIKVAVMVPSVGNYKLKPSEISIEELHKFMLRHFKEGRPERMEYYYVIHDYLMDLIEKHK